LPFKGTCPYSFYLNLSICLSLTLSSSPVFITLKAFLLYTKDRLSFRELTDLLNFISLVTIYKLIIKLSSCVSILVSRNVFKVCSDETLVLFKEKKFYTHIVVPLGHNMCESKLSLFRDFVRAKRGFKNTNNLELYVSSFCVVRNPVKLMAMISAALFHTWLLPSLQVNSIKTCSFSSL